MKTAALRDNKYLRLCVVAGLVVLLDQITKAYVMAHMSLYESIPVVPGLFSLTYIQNPGGAFGFLSGQGEGLRRLVFLFFASGAIVLVLYLYLTCDPKRPVLALGFALIFGGAVGNMIDRVRFGGVVDFLDVFIKDVHWPAFNVADSAVTVGIGIFIYHLLFIKEPPKAAKS